MSEKYEFASEAWILKAALPCIEKLAEGQDLSGLDVTLCEEFVDPPKHLSPSGEPIGWVLRLQNGKIDVRPEILADADIKITVDYATALTFAPLTSAEIAANPPDPATAAKLEQGGKNPAKSEGLAFMGELHDTLIKYTLAE